MRVFLLGFTVFSVFALFARWYFVCELRHRCGGEVTPLAAGVRLELRYGDQAVLSNYEPFRFDFRSAKPLLGASHQEFLERTAEWLNQHPDQYLTITGHFLPSEATAPSGFFENIGIARASAIESLLQQKGVDPSRITLDYVQEDTSVLWQPVTFTLYTPQSDASDVERLQFSFEDNTFSDADFEYNSDVFNPGEKFRLYADSLKAYLASHPEKMLLIIGHTDSIGDEQYNLDLGMRRARSVAKYLESLGIGAPMQVESKGEALPVAPNTLPDGSDNPAGRKKNRRVNIRIVDVPAKQMGMLPAHPPNHQS